MMEEKGMDRKDVIMSIFTAGAFGMVIAQNACIAGAQGGCQAECGSASGMAAAAWWNWPGDAQQAADACAMAIANQLGLVCDRWPDWWKSPASNGMPAGWSSPSPQRIWPWPGSAPAFPWMNVWKHAGRGQCSPRLSPGNCRRRPGRHQNGDKAEGKGVWEGIKRGAVAHATAPFFHILSNTPINTAIRVSPTPRDQAQSFFSMGWRGKYSSFVGVQLGSVDPGPGGTDYLFS